MIGRLTVAAGLAGIAIVHQLQTLPGVLLPVLMGGMGAGLLALGKRWMQRRRGCASRWLWRVGLWILVASVSAAVTVHRAQQRLDQHLAPGNVDKVSRVILRVHGLPRLQADKIRFEADILQAHPPGVPRRVLVSWSAAGWRSPYAAPTPAEPPFPVIQAGQVWRMALVLRPVHAAQNIAAFDYEAHVFAQGIRALGTVRGVPEYQRDDGWQGVGIIADRARHEIREAMAPFLQGLRYGAVLRALAIGDQDGMEDADWQVFNRTGLSHLVSISGSHITMLAGVAAWLTQWVWRRGRWRGRILAERWPARRAAACAALLFAWLYCLLAGWGVPAQRTFMMLAVVAGAQLLQLRLSGARVLALAAVVVCALDPWALLASGFWLSFAAVAVLLAVGARLAPKQGTLGPGAAPVSAGRLKRFLHGLGLAARLQWAITLALAPVLAWVFHEISLVSPLANAYAIPVIELLVTPLSLLLAAVSLVPGLAPLVTGLAQIAHGILSLMMHPTEWLAALPSWPVAAGPVGGYVLACGGAAFALWPHSLVGQGRLATSLWRLRPWAWLGLVPMMIWKPATPVPGEWDAYALDVGQGSAVIIRTARHAFLFDAGARHARDSDEGQRTVVPVLRALGIRQLDVMVLSHADLDHAGGARSVLAAMPVQQTYSSFDLPRWLSGEARRLDAAPAVLPMAATACLFGGRWQVDDVSFEFLWPLDERLVRKGGQANAGSCVLRVRGRHHSALLTGDIEARTEAALVQRGLTPVDVVVAAHHGSRTSSSALFVDTVAARHLIVQVGRWNRHNHPASAVLQRWQAAGAEIWRTDWLGGVNVRSRANGLSLYSVLESSRRYWHGRRP
ncbi:DNA internalization-related competence protein ComEC/Rec2 [Castellaniella sp. FW104-16D08]|uniref:DNA internalization-related competence protein ComEC/Rec2 n=1 Tax=unclassified Castellaniella TaxID=2617606 RepID=UPI003314E465